MTRLISFTYIVWVASLFFAIAQAAKVNGVISTNGILPDVSLLSPSTRVTLNGAAYTTLIKKNGEFEFLDIVPGSYLLEIRSIDYIFPKLRVDVTEDGDVVGAYTGSGHNWASTGLHIDHPFELRAKLEAEYFVKKQGFNLLGMFKNPMFLMLGFSGIAMFILPMMMKNLDPEAMKEINASQSEAQKMLTEMPSISKMFNSS
ncbi:hypothetical protein J3Q64DRAFT_1850642 [Phycomyces blakesleeanus]|uniref:ER membrane protein complex subunit 7 beta-sandwich domain-containing protein n=2 Tax=Phycomyces blakesleeanus TaxID=4837 RepID=A0A167JH14_PHYB8|nr:hypothetical protein PHYBLDRAFT_184014 [Phycomyces blakesleeanus NRRL 1555(-)]OAD65967.1 hypothetical protein PHYBLDRAFT_184014 [Phycomyces blakesleeanus NRRL 1555(-)]|eukprot:XP_018284007.1 hypothetical protein PHYBLDRAFT_184014 [Phycomyces blakesleeanus NRRL 1555(-)]